MSDSRELKELLERLRKEAGSAPVRAPQPEPSVSEARPQAAAPYARQPAVTGHRPWPQAEPRRFQEAGFKSAETKSTWGENKEAFLFGLFSSLLLALGGVLSGFEYLSLIGGCCFMVFGAVMALALYGHCRETAAPAVPSGMRERLEALSRKVEALAGRPASAAPAAREDSRELEQKVEELRVMVKSLARVVGGEK